jgi:hypothetical protein
MNQKLHEIETQCLTQTIVIQQFLQHLIHPHIHEQQVATYNLQNNKNAKNETNKRKKKENNLK